MKTGDLYRPEKWGWLCTIFMVLSLFVSGTSGYLFRDVFSVIDFNLFKQLAFSVIVAGLISTFGCLCGVISLYYRYLPPLHYSSLWINSIVASLFWGSFFYATCLPFQEHVLHLLKMVFP